MATTIGERLEREVQLMESDAAARYHAACARAPVCKNEAVPPALAELDAAPRGSVG